MCDLDLNLFPLHLRGFKHVALWNLRSPAKICAFCSMRNYSDLHIYFKWSIYILRSRVIHLHGVSLTTGVKTVITACASGKWVQLRCAARCCILYCARVQWESETQNSSWIFCAPDAECCNTHARGKDAIMEIHRKELAAQFEEKMRLYTSVLHFAICASSIEFQFLLQAHVYQYLIK